MKLWNSFIEFFYRKPLLKRIYPQFTQVCRFSNCKLAVRSKVGLQRLARLGCLNVHRWGVQKYLRSCQLTASLCLLKLCLRCRLIIWKRLVRDQSIINEKSSSFYRYNRQPQYVLILFNKWNLDKGTEHSLTNSNFSNSLQPDVVVKLWFLNYEYY